MKKVYIRTFGCQMNVRDSQIIMAMLQDKGYSCSWRMEEADVILFLGAPACRRTRLGPSGSYFTGGVKGFIKKDLADRDFATATQFFGEPLIFTKDFSYETCKYKY